MVKKVTLSNSLLKLIFILPFLLYFIIATYKLAAPSLWLDEALEYTCSSNNLSFLNSMLQHGSMQPPLYSFILFFWLKINQSVFWLRFLSVLCGFFGAIGFYKSVKEISTQSIALISVVVYSCVFRFAYHFQEAAEYALMIGNVCWLMYFFIKSLKKIDIKNIILFNIFAALSFLSQYGASIIIVIFASALLLKAIINKDKSEIKNLIISYFVNFILVFIPTYQTYTKYQVEMKSYAASLFKISIEKNIFWDFARGFIETIKYNFYPNLTYKTNEIFMNFHIPDIIINSLIIFFLGLFTVAAVKILKSRKNIIIISMLKTPKSHKKMIITYLLWSSILAWVVFYIIVKVGLYSYGVFGYRWGLFITPLWLLTFIVTINEYLSLMRGSNKRAINIIGKALTYLVVLMTMLYCAIGAYGVYKHWEKENNQGMVQKWYELGGYKETTILYYTTKFSFLYYFEKDIKFTDDKTQNIVFMHWKEDLAYDECDKIFNQLLDNNFNYPMIYLCVSHESNDINIILLFFKNKGYSSEVAYKSYDAYIYKLVKNGQLVQK